METGKWAQKVAEEAGRQAQAQIDEAQEVATTMDTKQQVRILAEMCTRDEDGRHFTRRYSAGKLATLEEEGLVEITRPVHAATGIRYSQEYWSVEVTEGGQDLVDAYPEYWEATA